MKQWRRGQWLLYRSVLLMTLGGTLVLAIVLALLVGMSWRSAHRLEPLNRNLLQYGLLGQEYQHLADRSVVGVRPPVRQPQAVSQTAERLRSLAGNPDHFSAKTPEMLRHAADLLGAGGGSAIAGQSQFPAAMHLLGGAVREEVSAQQAMLQELKLNNQRELHAVHAIALILPLLVAAFWVLFRRRVLQPLNDLGYVMGLLARKDYRTVEGARINPVVRPLFDKYNRMVRRMQDLEEAHVKREAALRQELARVTCALLQQQAVLARADRLAALGDVVARMAHRLRNPLSGVLITLTNLREETTSDDHRERLRMSIDALQRGFRELTDLVEEARQDPEPPVRLRLRKLVDELFELVRYQIENESLVLVNNVQPDLVCRVPEAATQHALMNVLMNAVEAQRASEYGRIRVAAEDRGDRVWISVRDDGPGFPDSQLHARNHGPGPRDGRVTGLGLAVVRRFVEHQAGKLVLENPPGGGAQVALIIPQEQNHD